MSQKFKTHCKPSESYEVLEETTCDICGKKAPTADLGVLPNWEGRRESNQIVCGFGFAYVEVSMKFDLCPQCFHHKLVPWLKDQGVDINSKTY
jgi:hypothetical protein